MPSRTRIATWPEPGDDYHDDYDGHHQEEYAKRCGDRATPPVPTIYASVDASPLHVYASDLPPANLLQTHVDDAPDGLQRPHDDAWTHVLPPNDEGTHDVQRPYDDEERAHDV